MHRHPSVRNAAYDVDLALLREKDVVYMQYPSFNFNMYGFPLAPDVYKTHGGDLRWDLSKWKPGFGSQLGFTIPISTFGRTSNAKKAAHYNKLVAEKSFKGTQNNILKDAKRIYWNYLTINSFKTYIFEVIMPEFKNLVKQNEQKFEEGKISRFTLEDSRIDYLNIKTNFVLLKKQQKQLDNKLEILVNDSFLDDINIHFKIKYLYPIKLNLQSYIYYLNIARNNNITLQKAQYQEELAKYYLRYQKASSRPTIGFGAKGVYNYFDFYYPSDGYPAFPRNGFGFSLGFFLSWDLNVWKHTNNRKKAEIGYLKQVEGMKYKTLMLETSLSNAYENLRFQQSLLKNKALLVKIAQRSLVFISNDTGRDRSKIASDKARSLNKLFYNLKSYYLQVKNFNIAVANFENMLGKNIVDYNAQEKESILNEKA